MKKIFLTLLGVVLLAPSLKGQTTKTISLSFSANDFSVLYDSVGLAMITSDKYDLFYSTDTLHPALPYINVNVLIGPNEDFGSFSISKQSTISWNNIQMPPNPKPLTTSVQHVENNNSVVSYPSTYYPSSNVVYSGVHEMDGYRFLSFNVCPFRYYPQLNRLYLYMNIAINITLDVAQNSSGYNNNPSQNMVGYNKRKGVKNMVINKAEMDAYYSPTALSDTALGTYLIITNEALKPSFKRLANWKQQKGCPTDILSVEEINQTYTGSYLPLKIKTAIKNYYDNGLRYVLLAGDIDIIPSPYCHYILPVPGHPSEITPVDLYYACMGNPLDWNMTDSIFECIEVSDIDLAPEIAIGRISVSTIADAEAYIGRVVNYEKGININYNDSLLMCGVLGDYFGDGISIAERLCRFVYNDSIADIWHGDVVHFYDSHTDFPGDGSYHLNGNNLQSELSKGYSFVYENSHGGSSEWQLEWQQTDYNYRLSHAQSLTNNTNTIIATSACWTNAFQLDTLSLGEAFIRNPYSGIVSYIGNSASGIYSSKYALSGVHKLYASIIRNILKNNDNHIGESILFGKANFIPILGNSMMLWNYFCSHLMGDPEMPVYIDFPGYIDGVGISYLNGNVIVTTSDSCKVCITNKDVNTSDYFEVRKGVQHVFSNMNGCYNLCVTKPGYIPYIATLYTSDYIQNEILEGDTFILSENGIQIGRNVTISKPEGAVSVENGKTIIQSSNGVVIKNDFKVKLGAEFEIDTSN